MRRKLILILAVITACVFCSVSTALADYSGTITIGVAGNAVELTESLIAEFQSANPAYSGAQFVVEELSEADAAGEILDNDMQVDIYVFAQDQLSVFVSAGALKPLSEDYATEAASANVEGAVAAARVGDTMYAFPMTADNGYFLYYDRTVITNPGSLESILEDCEDNNRLFCMELSSGWYQTAFFFGAGASLNYTMNQNGRIVSATVDYDSPEGLTALKSIRKVAASSAFVNISNYEDLGHPEDIGAIVSGTWDYQGLKAIFGDNLGCAKLPTVDGYQLSGFGGYKLAGVTPQTDSEKEAICEALAAYLTNEASQLARFEALGWGPSNTAAAASEEVQEDEALAALNAQLQYCVPQGQYPGEYWSVAEEMVTAVINGDCDDMDDDALQDFLADYQTRFENFVAVEQTWTCGDGVTCTLSVEGVLTISGTGEITSHPWTASDVRLVVINEGVTSIGSNTFYNCKNLTSVTIPATVTSIGEWAYSNCRKLSEIIVSPDNPVYSSADGVLYNKDKTELITCPEGKTNVSIPEGVTSIGERAFYQCTSLTSITIPNTVTSIGDYAFYYCSNLSSVTIPDSMVSIGRFAFSNCSSLTSITIPGGVTNIGSWAFSDCTSLTSVMITHGVTSIEDGVFSGCTNLQSIEIPDSVTSIGNYVFDSCGNLTSFSVGTGNTVYSVDDGVLFNKEKTELISCPNGKTGNYLIPDGVTNIGSQAFRGCTSLTGITIPDGVTSIGDNAFYSCRSLICITIPDSVTSIGDGAFASCSSLTGFSVGNGNTSFSVVDGVLFNNLKTELIAYPNGKSDSEYTIPDGVTSIGFAAFSDCDNLSSITVPDGVTSIGSSAFSDCTGLMDIALPDSLTSIGHWAFSYCSSLQSISIPDSVTSIGYSAFRFSSSLQSITIPDGVTDIMDGTFFYCGNLTSITIPVSVTTVGNDAFTNCYNLSLVNYAGTQEEWEQITISRYGNETLKNATIIYNYSHEASVIASGDCGDDLLWTLNSDGLLTITGEGAMSDFQWNALPWNDYISSISAINIEDGVTSIGDSAFTSCSNLTSITVPGSVTSIGYFAFYNCSSLTSVTIPDSVTSIDAYAFAACSNLISITIPDSVTSISDSVFGQCSSLTSIVIPNSVTSIGSSVFYGCTGLTSVTIPDSVTSIGLGAFSSCSSLTSITIPASVTSLGNDVFEGCSSLTEIVFLGTEDEWHTLIANTNNSKLDDCTITCTGGSAVSDEHIILSENLQLTDVETEYYSSGILIFSTTVKGPSDVAEVRIASWRSTEPTADEAQEAAQTMVSTLKQSTDSFEPKALPFNVDSSTYVYLSDLGKPRYFILAGMDTSVNLVGYAVIKVDIQGEELLPAPTWTLEPENPTENDLVTIWLDQTYDELRTWLYKDGEPLYGENAVTVRRNCSSIGSSEYEQGSYRFIIDGKKNGFWTEQTIVEFTVVPGENSEKLILPRGLTTIETEAFLDVAASEIDIPDSVTLIGDNAFPDDVTMIVGSGTYAESWAIANGYTPVTR